MAFTLASLASMLALQPNSDETAVVADLARKLDRLTALEASAPALEAKAIALEADLKAALATMAAAPAPVALEVEVEEESAPMFKPGDKVVMDGTESAVKEDIGKVQAYMLEDGRCAPEGMLTAVSSETAARASDYTAGLMGFARVTQSKMPEPQIAALGLSIALGKLTLAQAQEQIGAVPAVPEKVVKGMGRQETRGQAPATSGTVPHNRVTVAG